MNLAKEVKDLYLKICKILMKEIKMRKSDGKIYHADRFEELILLKWPYYPGKLQIQFNPSQNTNDIFHRTRTNISKMCMETQKTPNSQSNLEKEKQNWRKHVPRLQTILQSYSNLDSMVLAQKQKYRSVEQDRKPRHQPMHIWSPYLW